MEGFVYYFISITKYIYMNQEIKGYVAREE